MSKAYTSFKDFYPFYLSQHVNSTCRRLHVVGSASSLALAAYLVYAGLWHWLPVCLVIGYFFAWVGHFIFEKNRPATFTYPLYSFMGDWKMLWQVVTGQMRF